MLIVKESERGTGYIYDNELPIAKIYQVENGIKVHMYIDDYEFECGSIDEVIPLVRIRWERPKEWN